jgi:hypothetical protein
MRARDLDTSNAASGLTSRCADRTPLACSMTGRLFNAVCSCSSTMSRLRARRACTMADGGGIGQRLRRREVLVSHRRDLGGTEEVEPAKGLPRRRIGRAMTWRSRRRWRHGRSSATGPAHPPAGAPAPAGRGDSRIDVGTAIRQRDQARPVAGQHRVPLPAPEPDHTSGGTPRGPRTTPQPHSVRRRADRRSRWQARTPTRVGGRAHPADGWSKRRRHRERTDDARARRTVDAWSQ